MTELEMLHDLARIGRGRRHQILPFADARRRTVIHDEPVLTQHYAVTDLADSQGRESVDVNAVQETRSVRAHDGDFSESRYVADPDPRTHGRHLANDALQPVGLTAPGEP